MDTLFPTFELKISEDAAVLVAEQGPIDAWLQEVTALVAQRIEADIFAAMQRGETSIHDETGRVLWSWPALTTVPSTREEAHRLLLEEIEKSLYG
jgi:hypothetical protein